MLKKTTAILALKTFLNSLVAGILTFFLFSTIAIPINKEWVTVILTCLNIFIALSIIYTLNWREAQRDHNRVKFNHMPPFIFKGLVAGLFATIPFLIVFIIYAFNINNTIIYIIYLAFNLPYLSFVAAFKESAAVLWILILPMPASACVGYLLGYKQFSIMDKLVYKNKPVKGKPAAR